MPPDSSRRALLEELDGQAAVVSNMRKPDSDNVFGRAATAIRALESRVAELERDRERHGYAAYFYHQLELLGEPDGAFERLPEYEKARLLYVMVFCVRSQRTALKEPTDGERE